MNTPITSSELAILGTTQLTPGKMWRPQRSFDLGFPPSVVISQVQQIKSATQSPSPTQGVPQPLQNLQVTRVRQGSNVLVRVAFTSNPSDPNFKGAQVVLQQGSGAPTTIASGTTSPMIFTVPRSTAAASVTAQSTGSWGDATVAESPARALSFV